MLVVKHRTGNKHEHDADTQKQRQTRGFPWWQGAHRVRQAGTCTMRSTPGIKVLQHLVDQTHRSSLNPTASRRGARLRYRGTPAGCDAA